MHRTKRNNKGKTQNKKCAKISSVSYYRSISITSALRKLYGSQYRKAIRRERRF